MVTGVAGRTPLQGTRSPFATPTDKSERGAMVAPRRRADVSAMKEWVEPESTSTFMEVPVTDAARCMVSPVLMPVIALREISISSSEAEASTGALSSSSSN